MIRRISTKWVLSVLAAVVVPFVGYAWFVNVRVSERMSEDVVRFHLLSMAADLAERLDEEIRERRSDVAMVAGIDTVSWYLQEPDPKTSALRAGFTSLFDGLVRNRGVYDYVIAIDLEGQAVGTNTVFPDGAPIPAEVVGHFSRQDYAAQDWYREALETGSGAIDFHRVDLRDLGLGGGRLAGGWYVGWAHRVDHDPRDGDGPRSHGVLLALMNWEHVQRAVSSYGVRQLREEGGGPHPVGEDIYGSSYAWVWKSDADTIIAHPNQDLYGKKVSELEGGALEPLVEAARKEQWGMYPRYEFAHTAKRAAFRHCEGTDQGGFGWVVGVGVDDVDIDAPVKELSSRLLSTSAVILGLAILFTLWVAHRTTRPIRELEGHTRRVGHGDLDARIEVRSRDELGQLARSFNRMVSELKTNREQLVKAEKEAAWREMARQVAHEIKNPLTPIALSASLLRRARDEKSPEFDAILDRTIDMIQRQVENMREVARDFYAFAGEHKDPRPVEVLEVLHDVLALHGAWAEERGVRFHEPPANGPAVVRADPDELQRALLNLVTNSIEAMPDGGDLSAQVEVGPEDVTIEIRDTGPGISDEIRERLFEPYFTTRTSGTGLGLAIVRRIVEDLGGSVVVENAAEGHGSVARMVLPRCAESA